MTSSRQQDDAQKNAVMRLDAQNVCDLLFIANRDGAEGEHTLAELGKHWAASPLPTEQLAGLFLLAWDAEHPGHHEPLFAILFDMVDCNFIGFSRHAENLGELKTEVLESYEWTWEIFARVWNEREAGDP